MKKDKFHVPPPQIPGTFYKGLSNNQEALLLFTLGCISMAILDRHSIEIVLPVFLLLLSFLTWKIFPPKPRSVYISPTTVKANFGIGNTISDDLKNYYLYIGTRSGRTIKGYTYYVGLKPKEQARMGRKSISKKYVSQNPIPLRLRILTPANLKEYIEAFQKQIDEPLEMIFESEKILEEVQSGEFIK